MYVACLCSTCFCVVLCVCFVPGRFVMVLLNLTYLHCLQHSLFEHLFNLCYKDHYITITKIINYKKIAKRILIGIVIIIRRTIKSIKNYCCRFM